MVHCLLEVHSVQVFISKTEGVSNEIFGSIKIDDNGLGNMELFNVDEQHAKSISTDGILPLSGPFRCIMGQTCVIGTSLKEKNRGLEVSNGCLSLKHEPPIYYDRPSSLLFEGDYGHAILNVSLFKYAVQASVEVVFVPKGGGPKPGQYTIFGQVSAQYSSFRYKSESTLKYHQTRLFDFTQENVMKLCTVAHDDVQVVNLPLSRSVVAVPINNWLVIDTQLWVNDSGISSQDCPSELVSGTALFFHEISDRGTVTEYIEGNLGTIKVSVNWLHDVKEKYSVNWRRVVQEEDGQWRAY